MPQRIRPSILAMWGTPGLACCSRRSNCDVGLDRALITSQSWTRTLAPSSGPASLPVPPMKISRGWDPLSLLHPKVRSPRSQSSRSSGWVHGRRARRPTDGVPTLSPSTESGFATRSGSYPPDSAPAAAVHRLSRPARTNRRRRRRRRTCGRRTLVL